MVVGQDELLEGRVLVLGAPELAVADPEHLPGAVGQSG
jgi:hypothetical protein